MSGLYTEVDKLAKKSPTAPLSDFATTRLNRSLRDAKQMLGAHDKYASDFARFVDAGENPEIQDALLALREIKQAIGRVYQIMAFVEAFEVSEGAVVSFADASSPTPVTVAVGQQHITPIDWPADPLLSATDAADVLTDRVAAWIDAAGGLSKSALARTANQRSDESRRPRRPRPPG